MFQEYGFKKEFHVEGRASIANLLGKRSRCGIYILHFRNDQYYVGQAKDVTRRYIQHRQNHDDIIKLSFKKVRRKELDEEERHMIWSLEQQGFALRNVTYASIPKGESDFDLIMPVKQQERWLEDLTFIDLDGDRLKDPALRIRYTKRYEQFMTQPQAEQIITFLQAYVRVGIPAIKRGEVSFWCLSCLPAKHVYNRINVGLQEVLTLFDAENMIWCSFHLALTPIDYISDKEAHELDRRYPHLISTDHFYKSGGVDQGNLQIPLSDAIGFIHEPIIAKSIRLFNWRLMKKGACLNSRFHCLDLADKIIAS